VYSLKATTDINLQVNIPQLFNESKMKPKDYTGIIPPQYTGEEIESEASVTLDNESAAVQFYDIAKRRLLHVNHWHEIAGALSAKFQLTDANGNDRSGAAQQGYHLKVDIPGPGSGEGGGYDWVSIEDVKEVAFDGVQSTGFRVRPAPNPRDNSQHVAHFYDPNATSNFIITREGNTVTASIVDRNLKPNKDAETVVDKIRHTVAGVAAINTFSKLQWQSLADGLVKGKQTES
jgi:hypothetical protein